MDLIAYMCVHASRFLYVSHTVCVCVCVCVSPAENESLISANVILTQ